MVIMSNEVRASSDGSKLLSFLLRHLIVLILHSWRRFEPYGSAVLWRSTRMRSLIQILQRRWAGTLPTDVARAEVPVMRHRTVLTWAKATLAPVRLKGGSELASFERSCVVGLSRRRGVRVRACLLVGLCRSCVRCSCLLFGCIRSRSGLASTLVALEVAEAAFASRSRCARGLRRCCRLCRCCWRGRDGLRVAGRLNPHAVRSSFALISAHMSLVALDGSGVWKQAICGRPSLVCCRLPSAPSGPWMLKLGPAPVYP